MRNVSKKFAYIRGVVSHNVFIGLENRIHNDVGAIMEDNSINGIRRAVFLNLHKKRVDRASSR